MAGVDIFIRGISPEAYKKLKKLAKAENRSVNKMIRAIIEDYVEGRKDGK